MPLGVAGYDGIASAPASALVRPRELTVTPVSTRTLKVATTTAAASGLAYATRSTTSLAASLVLKAFTLSTTTATLTRGTDFTVTAPVTTYVIAHRPVMAVNSSVALFPDSPVRYIGNIPKQSTNVADLISLLPSYFNVDEESETAISVGVSRNVPPPAATSALIGRHNPASAPVVNRVENIKSTLRAGGYQAGFTFRTNIGETKLSPVALLALDTSSTQGIQFDTIVVPTGITEVRYYLKPPDSDVFSLVATSTTGAALVVNGIPETITVRVSGTLIEVIAIDNELPPFVADLRDFTIGSLSHSLQLSGYLTNVSDGWQNLAATTLLDGYYGPAAQVNLAGFTSVLWRVIRPLALCFDLWSDDLHEMSRQMDVRFAAGRWLDWWGILYGVPRMKDELDDHYRRRITWEVMAPRANNIALEIILKEALGYESEVSDINNCAQTWYSNRSPFGSPIRDAVSGVIVGTVPDTNGAYVLGLSPWDSGATYNSSTYTWTAGDTTVLTWGLTNPTAAGRPATLWPEAPDWNDATPFVDPGTAPDCWPGLPGRFHVAVRQVVEDGQLGLAEITKLIDRYKAAGFLFTISVLGYYQETFATSKLGENISEEWQEQTTGAAGAFYTTMTMASLTMDWPPQVAREAYCFEEWSYDNGVTFTPYGTIATLRLVPDPEGNLPLGLPGLDEVTPLAPPGVVPTG